MYLQSAEECVSGKVVCRAQDFQEYCAGWRNSSVNYLTSRCVSGVRVPVRFLGSEREFVEHPIWRGLERLRPAAGRRLARQSLFSEPQIQRWRPVLWGGHFTQAAEVGKNPRIPLIAVGLAHLQGSLPEPVDESGFLTALPGSEGEYQPRPQESHGCRMEIGRASGREQGSV